MENVTGWLIIHTENQEHISFELKLGKNIIGRQTPGYKPDIAVGDEFVSRRHAVVFVKLNSNNFYEYYIADNKDVNEGKPSMNGTYVNGNTERINENLLQIIDGDTIQIGVTKFVLKAANISVDVQEAIKLVKRQEYQTTVDFKKQDQLRKKF